LNPLTTLYFILAPNPDILLLDEPLSALDAQVRLKLRQKIRSIQSQLNFVAAARLTIG
jgi:ABC-type sulfate/molybdate transport systems ATPase subunit